MALRIVRSRLPLALLALAVLAVMGWWAYEQGSLGLLLKVMITALR